MTANSQFLRALAVGLALALGACAKGASTFDDTANGGGGATSTTCNNGVVDLPLEQCEPSKPLDAAATCAALMPGSTGTVHCNPITCRYDTSMCGLGTGVAGMGH